MLELLRGPVGCLAAYPRPLLHTTRPGSAQRQHFAAPARSFAFAFRGAGHVEQEQAEVLQRPTASQDAESEHSIRARFAALSGRIRRQPPLSPEDSGALLAAFQAQDVTHVQDILVCAALAECSYKPVDHSPEEALSLTQEILADLVPPQLISLQSVQFCKPHVRHRYMLAESNEALYVGIIGTKLRRDLVTNANALLVRIWDNDDGNGADQEVPAAHRGFLRRADAVPIEQLFLEACRRKKRLVVCGHSLGGAVATLCTLRLLRQLPQRDDYPLRCVAFATPSIGNAALSALVSERRWDTYVSNFLLPEDVVVQLTSPSQYRAVGESGPAALAETRPDMRRLLNPTASMIATAATLTGLAAAAGVPATTAAAASAAAMAARMRWSGGGGKPACGAVAAAELETAQTAKLASTSAAGSPASSELLQAADEALMRARRISDSAVSKQSAAAALHSSHMAQESSAPRSSLLERGQQSSPSSTHADSRKEADSHSGGSSGSSGVSRTGSRYSFKFPWAVSSSDGGRSSGSGEAGSGIHGMAVDCAGGDHSVDGHPRSRNPKTHDAAQLTSLSVQHRRGSKKRSRPGSLVVQPAVRVSAESASAGSATSPETMLVHGRPATASAATAAPARLPAPAQVPSGWHWGPPDPVKAAAWAGARKAVRFASLPADAARGAAQIVSYPVRKAMSVARAYVPLSNSQMYVLPTRVTANAQDLATAAARTPVPGVQAAVGDGALRETSDVTGSHDGDVSGATASLDRQEAEELSAAEAQRGGKGQRRSFFLMHRMASYRARLKNIWQTAIGPERVAAWQAAASPPALVLTDTLGPRMTNLQAGGTLPTPTLPGPEQLVRLFPADSAATKRQRQVEAAGDAPTTSGNRGNSGNRWQMANPLAWLGRRAAEARPAAVDVDITVLGRGLEHCTGVRITVNNTGATCPLRIIRQPQATFDAQVWPPTLDRRDNLDKALEVVPQFFARVQQAANAVLRNRPDTALLDSMTIRARIPAAVAQSCSVVSSNPLLQLGRDPPSGSGQLTIQLQSDFQTAKLPLDLCASDGEAVVSRLLQQLNTKKSEGNNA